MAKKIKEIFSKINISKKQTKNLNEGHRLFFLFLGGIIVGTLFVNILGANYARNISIYGNYLTDNTDNISIVAMKKNGFFFYCIKKYLFQVVVLVVINLTSKGRVFNSLICFYKGGVISVLVCAATISYGKGGILVFLISIFPHYIMYIPLFIYTINYGMYLKSRRGVKKDFIIKSIGIECFFIFMTAFLEAYGNLPLINNMF